MRPIDYQDSRLLIDGVSAEDIAAAAGTPCYVYSAGLVRDRLRRVREAFDGLELGVRYAIKANGNGALLRLLVAEGAGFDIVSGGELQRAQRAGADPASIVFAGVGKQEWEIRDALRAGIGVFNVEGEAELERLAALAKAEQANAKIALRVNPDVGVETHAYITTGKKENKFGVDLETASRLVPRVHDDAHLSLHAYHVHLGSLLLEAEPYLEAARRVLDFMDADEGHRRGVRAYDMGGGFGSSGPFSDEILDLATLGAGMRELLAPRGLELLTEPGRFLIGDAGVLLTRVLYEKHGKAKDFVIVDAAMNDLIRPALYQAEHEVRPVQLGAADRERPVDVVGPVCESADFLALGRKLPPLDEGQLLAIFSAGAYSASMASNYNSRPVAPEVLSDQGQARLVRRRQELEELWAGECDEKL